MIKSLLDEFQILMGLNISYMPEEYREDIFHYASPVDFKSILFDDKEDIALWASRFDCQNERYTKESLSMKIPRTHSQNCSI